MMVLLGCALFVVTSLLHLLLTHVVFRIILKADNKGVTHRLLRLELIIVAIVFFTLFEAMAWAACFVWRGGLTGVEEAVYFSLVTYTSLGYGDLVLEAPNRLLSALEAANGAIIFGWSTALVMQSLQRLFGKQPG